MTKGKKGEELTAVPEIAMPVVQGSGPKKVLFSNASSYRFYNEK
jgi:hypothetical protein